MNNIKISIYILLGLILISGGVYLYTSKSSLNQPQQPEPQENSLPVSGNPNVDTKITSIESTTTKEATFSKYGFSLYLPEGWKSKIIETNGFYMFDLHPPQNDSPLWGGFGIKVTDYQPTIEKWIEVNDPQYKDKVVIKREADFGGKPRFFLLQNNGDELSDYRAEVILGSKYSYIRITPYQDGANDFPQRLEKEIFPHIVVE